jgi:hypothetical protein
MSMIRMETENVRDAARKIDYAVQELSLKPRRLKSAANSLKSAWRSRQATRFANELKRKAAILDNEVVNLQQLAQRMRNEVSEWESQGGHFGNGQHQIHGEFLRGSLGGKEQENPDSGSARAILEGIYEAREGVGKGLLFGGVVAGGSYSGQLIFKGGRSLKEVAGVSPHLTHIKSGNLWKHMGSTAKAGPVDYAFTAWEFWEEEGREDFYHYQGSEKISAIKYDAGFVVAKTIVSHKAAAVATGFVVGAVAASTVVASAPVLVAGAVVAGAAVLTWWGVSTLVDGAMDGAYSLAEDSGLKDTFIKTDSHSIETSVAVGKEIVNVVDNVFQSTIQLFKPRAPQAM